MDAINERKALAARLAQHERERVLGRLAATVAHQVRNPLGGTHRPTANIARKWSGPVSGWANPLPKPPEPVEVMWAAAESGSMQQQKPMATAAPAARRGRIVRFARQVNVNLISTYSRATGNADFSRFNLKVRRTVALDCAEQDQYMWALRLFRL